MFQLTLQLYSNGQWQDAMALKFPEPDKGFNGSCRFGCTQDYLIGNLEVIDSPFLRSVSASGLPDVAMNHPQIALKNLDQRLRTWGLK